MYYVMIEKNEVTIEITFKQRSFKKANLNKYKY